MQAQPQSHLAQHSAMRRRWAWKRISQQIAYMCVASTTRLSLSAGPERAASQNREYTCDAARTLRTDLSLTLRSVLQYFNQHIIILLNCTYIGSVKVVQQAGDDQKMT